MTDQIIYDQNGTFQCVQRTYSSGLVTMFGPGSNLWPEYVNSNGLPAPTGVPTVKPVIVARAVHAVFLDLQNLNLSTANSQKLLLALTAFLLVNGGSFGGGDLKAYLLAEFPGVTIPDGSQLNP